MNKIRHIDPDKNGCVTTSEMDDILKEVYPLKLGRWTFLNFETIYCDVESDIFRLQ